MSGRDGASGDERPAPGSRRGAGARRSADPRRSARGRRPARTGATTTGAMTTGGMTTGGMTTGAMTAVQPARRVAYETLRAVHESDAYANLLLPRAIERAGLSTADAALATELTYGTLRRQGTYDAIIALAADRDATAIDPPVLDTLRLGAHQLLSTRVASHAAVNESVELARDAGGRGAAGFVNAVLRRVSRDTPGEWLTRVEERSRSADERLGLVHSHPVWVVRAFRRALAAEGRADELEALLGADNTSPRVTMAALPGIADVPGDVQRTPYSPVGFALDGGDPEALVSASEGRIRVQDEGSQLAALALSRAEPVRPGERWLDLCAGPGGKTALLAAEALAGGAVLEANEISPARAGLVRRAVAGVPGGVTVSEEDGRVRAEDAPDAYDRILVDAPCTGLGALRRRPEARWRKSPNDVPELTELQRGLLTAAVSALAPGGIVAYVTCSPHLAETAGVVAEVREALGDALEELDARAVLREIAGCDIDLPDPVSPPAPSAPTGSVAPSQPSTSSARPPSGRAQLWPHRHGTDAMSITLLRRIR